MYLWYIFEALPKGSNQGTLDTERPKRGQCCVVRKMNLKMAGKFHFFIFLLRKTQLPHFRCVRLWSQIWLVSIVSFFISDCISVSQSIRFLKEMPLNEVSNSQDAGEEAQAQRLKQYKNLGKHEVRRHFVESYPFVVSTRKRIKI